MIRSALSAKPPRQKKCKCGCGASFVPRSPMQTAAGPECALRIVRQKAIKESAEKAKAERKADKTKREKLKSLRDWLRDAQAAVNAYVRERDKEKPCISCGRFHQGAYDAGHYRSTGSNPALRFHLDNIHRQCVPCNQHKGGNAIEYRLGLIKRIGIERVEWLESASLSSCQFAA